MNNTEFIVLSRFIYLDDSQVYSLKSVKYINAENAVKPDYRIVDVADTVLDITHFL